VPVAKFEVSNPHDMARTAKLQLKDVGQSKSPFRAIRQLLILVLTVIMGVLLSVSCNAQKTSAKKSMPYKKKNRAHVNHYAATPALDRTLLLTNILQQQIIKEMVAQNISENQNNNPVELAPLVFNLKADKLTAIDVNPILIAIEFGIQGKTILIQSYGSTGLPVHQQLSFADVQSVKTLMAEMGVPSERLSIVGCNNLQGVAAYEARIDFKAI
jgi:hypothetical protein